MNTSFDFQVDHHDNNMNILPQGHQGQHSPSLSRNLNSPFQLFRHSPFYNHVNPTSSFRMRKQLANQFQGYAYQGYPGGSNFKYAVNDQRLNRDQRCLEDSIFPYQKMISQFDSYGDEDPYKGKILGDYSASNNTSQVTPFMKNDVNNEMQIEKQNFGCILNSFGQLNTYSNSKNPNLNNNNNNNNINNNILEQNKKVKRGRGRPKKNKDAIVNKIVPNKKTTLSKGGLVSTTRINDSEVDQRTALQAENLKQKTSDNIDEKNNNETILNTSVQGEELSQQQQQQPLLSQIQQPETKYQITTRQQNKEKKQFYVEISSEDDQDNDNDKLDQLIHHDNQAEQIQGYKILTSSTTANSTLDPSGRKQNQCISSHTSSLSKTNNSKSIIESFKKFQSPGNVQQIKQKCVQFKRKNVNNNNNQSDDLLNGLNFNHKKEKNKIIVIKDKLNKNQSIKSQGKQTKSISISNNTQNPHCFNFLQNNITTNYINYQNQRHYSNYQQQQQQQQYYYYYYQQHNQEQIQANMSSFGKIEKEEIKEQQKSSVFPQMQIEQQFQNNEMLEKKNEETQQQPIITEKLEESQHNNSTSLESKILQSSLKNLTKKFLNSTACDSVKKSNKLRKSRRIKKQSFQQQSQQNNQSCYQMNVQNDINQYFIGQIQNSGYSDLFAQSNSINWNGNLNNNFVNQQSILPQFKNLTEKQCEEKIPELIGYLEHLHNLYKTITTRVEGQLLNLKVQYYNRKQQKNQKQVQQNRKFKNPYGQYIIREKQPNPIHHIIPTQMINRQFPIIKI